MGQSVKWTVLLKDSDQLWDALDESILEALSQSAIGQALAAGRKAFDETEVSSQDKKRAADLLTAIEKAGDRLDAAKEAADVVWAESMAAMMAEELEPTDRVMRGMEVGTAHAKALADAQEEHDAKVTGFKSARAIIINARNLAADESFRQALGDSGKSGGKGRGTHVKLDGKIALARRLGYLMWYDGNTRHVFLRREDSEEQIDLGESPKKIGSPTMLGKLCRSTAGYMTAHGHTAADAWSKTCTVWDTDASNLPNSGGVADTWDDLTEVGQVR